MSLGKARIIRVKQFSNDLDIQKHINKWLEDNPSIEIIDIKFSTSATSEDWATDALIIYFYSEEEQ